MQITAIILAGGKSKRMGTDKALLEIKGKSLLERSISLCKTVCNKIIISSNSSGHTNFGYSVISDEISNSGPMGGIFSCLKNSDTDWNFVVSVDSAFVEPDFVSFLISEIEESDAIVPVHSMGKEPLIALYNKSCLSMLEDKLQINDYKMHNLLNSINTNFVDSQIWVEKYPKLFYNINRPEDLHEVKL